MRSPAARPDPGPLAAYAAAALALGYAVVSLYWGLGGRALISTVGGYAETAAHRGGGLALTVALGAAAVKVAGALLALALVRPWGQAIRRRWLLVTDAVVSAVLIGYGGLNVLAGALVLGGAIHPSGQVDRTALRWHAGLWDLWFLVWGLLLALATVAWARQGPGQAARPFRV
jgi:hypothetical protein